MPFRPVRFALLSLIAIALAAVYAPHPTAAHAPAAQSRRVGVTISRHQAGAPITLGVPCPKGALASPDHVRVLDARGAEVAAQVTEVTTWEPADPSIKWIWVFFFATESSRYSLEYGPAVRRTRPPQLLESINNPRAAGLAELSTGPLRVVVRQGDTGFLTSVQLDLDGNGFGDADEIAAGPAGRGSFADVLDDAGVDASKATILRTTLERGTGPLHAVLRVDGEYRYGRADNQVSPFVTRIHAYAGRTYIRVLHTWVYTGTPDHHRPQEGDYPHVATQTDKLIVTDPADTGWTRPQDRLQALGLSVTLRLGDGKPGAISRAQLTAAPGAPGWVHVSDGTRGVAVALKHFVEEYPKELAYDPATNALTAFFWSPKGGAASFARSSNAPANEGAVENWATGLAKTSEALWFFHGPAVTSDHVRQTMNLMLAPPVGHLDPAWYGQSGVYGAFAPRSERHPELQRALDYKFAWMRFNQQREPWYGMFNHGDMMNTFDGTRWSVYGHGEPAQDFMWWLQFMRTGDPDAFDTAQAFSRHLMDVDNTHWPAGPAFVGDTNYPMDWWNTLKAPAATKYLGVGRRHAEQHWMHILSAHVWVQGWMASYYLAADQRALDVARMTADMHLRRLWGDHELTGRRLYLSIWNLAEVWDATKDARYEKELDVRVAKMLQLQREQADQLAIERYGYANVYATHGLWKYFTMTERADVRAGLVRNARAVRDIPPLNHMMESYLATIHGLSLGYRLTGDVSFKDEMLRRLEPLRTSALPRPIDNGWSTADLFAALEKSSRLPADPNRIRPNAANEYTAAPPARRAIWSFTNGLRVFGWTTAYSVPWAIQILNEIEDWGLRIEDWGLGIEDWGLGIGDWGLRIED
jgi:hypothetical protein